MRILVINPGSTSVKLGVFEGASQIFNATLEHAQSEPESDGGITEKASEIRDFLQERGMNLEDFDAIACRGGILPPMESGTYLVDESMVDYLLHCSPVEHPSNLAAPIGFELARGEIPVFITDPISVDELSTEARYSGLPQIPRVSRLHALNMKAAARQVAGELARDVNSLNLVIAHLGGGVSVGLQLKGRMVDVNNANDEGPFSPTRSGELPVGDLAKMCFEGPYDQKELIKRYTKTGGLKAYLDTDDLREAMKIARDDSHAEEVVRAMAYGIAKEIGGMCAIAAGQIDAIVLTGGMAYNSKFTEMIKDFVGKFALVVIVPGENELLSLALGAQRVLCGAEKARQFKPEVVL